MKQKTKDSIRQLLLHFLYDILRPYVIRFVRHFIKYHIPYLCVLTAALITLILLSPETINHENYNVDLSEKPSTISAPSPSNMNGGTAQQYFMTDKSIIFDTGNAYWDKLTIQGNVPAQYQLTSENTPYIIELPENFINEIDTSELNKIISKSILGFSIKSIYDSQYIYLNCDKNYPLRIYIDTMNENILHIDIAKNENPYHSLVVIDPGHGGSDPGAINGDICEKDIVLDIALRMEHKLKDIGVNTIYTRNIDKELYYRWITDYTNFLKPDAFISIHNNSYEKPGPNGIATYYYTSEDSSKDQIIKLATLLQDSLIKEFPDWTDMGIEKRDYWVVRKSDSPGALIEFG
ncbi:MAG: N-acetylmuramoyl-L-alanine amidase, partial [Clostridia bacterium]